MISVLVTDGENRAVLAVTRSLGKMGCKEFFLLRQLKLWPVISQLLLRGAEVQRKL